MRPKGRSNNSGASLAGRKRLARRERGELLGANLSEAMASLLHVRRGLSWTPAPARDFAAMPSRYTAHVVQSMNEIDAAEWDACANPGVPEHDLNSPRPNRPADAAEDLCVEDAAARELEQSKHEVERFNPFITHAFLKALETSKSVAPRHGWTSRTLSSRMTADISRRRRRPI